MKATIKVEKEVDLRFMHVAANVRYWEDAEIDGVADEDGTLTPCKEGDLWKPVIDIDSGIITNWQKGKTASIHFKVCDQCAFWLEGIDGERYLVHEDGYVPSILCPGDNGYGDYIIMEIDADGKIQDWEPAQIEDMTPGDED